MKRTPNHFKLSTCTSIALGLLTASAAHAHEGHGMPGLTHWHSTDVWGFIALAGMVAVVIWMKGRK